ncbi:MAG: phosphatase PAP2 family protein [Coriobacteriia bacterium]|nr:phosphatase PAP2 family protein [Coriobacteriia bacterium]
MDTIYAFDLMVFEWIQTHLWCKFLDIVMSVVSLTGETGAIWIVFAIVLLFFKKTRKTGIMMGVALIVMLIVNDNILKPLIARPRPFDYPGWPGFIYPEIAFRVPTSFSFPSGHTCAAVAVTTVLLIQDRRLGIPAAVYAFLMCFSRIYLFDHYCTDVFGGIVLGIIIGVAAYYLVDFIAGLITKRKATKTIVVVEADGSTEIPLE